MKKTDSLFKQLHDANEKIKLLTKQLDEWIDSCKNQVDIFQEKDMQTSAISSDAMRIAYNNVKQLLNK